MHLRGVALPGLIPFGLFAALSLGASGTGFAQTIDPNLWVTNGSVNAIVRDGGTIYLGGTFTQVGPATGGGVPLDAASGSLPPSFPKVVGQVFATISDGAGGWYIGGRFSRVGGLSRSNLAHVSSDLTVSSWNPAADGSVSVLAASGTNIIAGGGFANAGGQARSRIVALDAVTGLATAWNPGANNYVYALAVSGSTIYAGGLFSTLGGQARNSIGAIDATSGVVTAWNPNAGSFVYALAVSGSKVYAGGEFTTIGGATRNRIAALDATTGASNAWDPDANSTVNALAVSGSTVYLGGLFTSVGGQVRNRIAALDATTGLATTWDPNADGQVTVLAVSGNTVYAGGTFAQIGGQSRSCLAGLSVTTGLASAWNPGANKGVYALAAGGSTIYAGGDFTSIGGVTRNYIAALDVSTGIATAWSPNANAVVRALAVSGSTVYAGGDFTSIGGQARNRIAALDATSGAATAWNPNSVGPVYALAPKGSTIYAGGNFSNIGGQARNWIAGLDVTSGLATAWNPNANSEVDALAVSGSTVYAGGYFSGIGGQTRNRIAALDATSGAATGWDPNANGPVLALALSGKTVYAGGGFTSIDGKLRGRIAALDATSGAATAWNPNADGGVEALAVNGSTVYAGGAFTSIGGQARNYVAALDSATGFATGWNPAANAQVRALAVRGGTAYASGDFTAIGGYPQAYIAAVAVESFTLTANANPGGLITPAGPVGVFSGGSRTFYLSPNDQSRIQDVRMDGVSVGPVPSYTFTNVGADHSLTATFVTDTAAAYRGWVTDGVSLTSIVADHATPMSVPDGEGGVFFTWWALSQPDAGIFAQHVSASGLLLWGAGGVVVNATPIQKNVPRLCRDGAGGVMIAWTQGNGAAADIYAQRISAQGAARWGAGGVAVCSAAVGQSSPKLSPDGSGGAIVTWHDQRTDPGGDLYAQRIDSTGAAQWTVNGVLVCDAANQQAGGFSVPDGLGGAIVSWQDYRGDGGIYVQRLNASGVEQWRHNGVKMCDVSGAQTAPVPVADGEGGAIVTWTDNRGANLDVYAGRIDASGALLWNDSTGVVVSAAAGNQNSPQIAPDGSGGALISWSDYRNGATTDAFAQRMSAAGSPVWTANGVAVCTAAGDQDAPVATSDGAGGAYLAWSDRRGLSRPFAQRLDAAGAPQWAANGVLLSALHADSNQVMSIESSGDGSALITWGNIVSAGNIRMRSQRVSPAGRPGFDHTLMTLTGPPLAGSITPSGGFGGLGVFDGSSQTFTAAAANGYSIQDLMVDSSSLGSVSSYTFFSLAANHSISATFTSLLSISQITPDRAGDDGQVSVVVTGVLFQPGATVKLTRSGQSDILGAQATVSTNGTSLTARFDLIGKAQGVWNVVVANPDLSGATLPNGFTIEAGASRQIRVDLVASPVMRPNRRRAFDIVLENLGNTDAVSMPLWITRIPDSATVNLDFALTPAPQGGGEPDWNLVPQTLSGPGGRYLPLVIPRIPPGASVRRISLTVPPSVTGFELAASLTPPWVDGAALRGCLGGAGVISVPSCMGAQLDAIHAYLAATPGIEALSAVGLWAKIAWQCEGAATLPAAIAKAEQVLDLMVQPIEQGGVPAGCEVTLVPRWRDTWRVAVVTSVDPNDKLGTNGYGASRLIGAGQILPYSIRFENLATATAPAQTVVVTDVLDVSRLDLSTLSLGPMKFGRRANGKPWTVDPGSGLTSYSTNVDLRPELNVVARVLVNLDRATGVLGWSLTSCDPDSLPNCVLPPDSVGFLPRNVTAPEGEGSLLFSVMAKPGLAGGAQIQNRATIDFDGAATQTPYWANLFDVTPPESQVLPLSVNQDSARFTVRWHALADSSDLRDYSVYVSEDGGPYRPWRVQTTATADTMVTSPGRQYRFYSLARDSSGNLESVPVTPDGVTQVAAQALAVGSGAWMLALEGAVPNPATTAPRVWFTLPSRERAVLEVMDVAGRRLYRRDVGAMGPGRHSVDVSQAARRPGLYFLRLAQGGRVLNSRMVVIR